jgi:hypothetical protein
MQYRGKFENLGDLSNFLATLNESQLSQPINLSYDEQTETIKGFFIVDTDYYRSKDDCDWWGTEEDIREQIKSDGYDDMTFENDFELLEAKGRIYLTVDVDEA